MNTPTRLLVDDRWSGQHGIARFSREVLARLGPSGAISAVPLMHPAEPVLLGLELTRRRPDVYFSPGFTPPLWSPVPFVFTIHDLIHLDVPEESSRGKRLYYDLVVRPAARRAARVLTVSEFSRRRIVEWAGVPGKRVVNVGNGVGEAYTPEGARHEPGYPYLLYVGNRKPHKNVPRLVEAFARLDVPDLRLVLSGGPDDDTRHLALRLGVLDRVVFAGLIPEVDLPAYYRGAVALAYPTLYEGFGLPALEAMACGTPVVTSNRTSLPEVVGDAALLVDPEDVEVIVAALTRVVADFALRTALASRGLARSRLFSWDRTAALVARVLEEASTTP
ncbi:glycosyltransferase family 4 protein [Deinococcus pimensis]|uniref:glycosyltransferase family 4 protein n=1 Tax=Deinococcus pimensis TaxID=309888 RepID=UPI0004802313|nr:glycosyltransferase family 1 protein [Deinococcus pimensis]